MENITQIGVTSNPDYWLEYAESLMPDLPQVAVDNIRKYGVRLWDGEHWIRHLIDKPNGSTHTLCGLPSDPPKNDSHEVHKTCDRCSEEQGRLRGK